MSISYNNPTAMIRSYFANANISEFIHNALFTVLGRPISNGDSLSKSAMKIGLVVSAMLLFNAREEKSCAKTVAAVWTLCLSGMGYVLSSKMESIYEQSRNGNSQ